MGWPGYSEKLPSVWIWWRKNCRVVPKGFGIRQRSFGQFRSYAACSVIRRRNSGKYEGHQNNERGEEFAGRHKWRRRIYDWEVGCCHRRMEQWCTPALWHAGFHHCYTGASVVLWNTTYKRLFTRKVSAELSNLYYDICKSVALRLTGVQGMDHTLEPGNSVSTKSKRYLKTRNVLRVSGLKFRYLWDAAILRSKLSEPPFRSKHFTKVWQLSFWPWDSLKVATRAMTFGSV